MTIRVAVVDDQALVRRGFAMVLGHEADIDVVAEGANGREAIEAARRHRPDVVLMDIRMPEMDGLAATAAILAEADWPVKVIILTTFDPDEYVYRALQAGASGFILKDIPPEQLAPAVRTVADGGALLDPTITRRLIGRFTATLAADTVAAFGLHGAYLCGPRRQMTDEDAAMLSSALKTFQIEIARDGETVDIGHGGNVLGSPLSALRHAIEVIANDPDAEPIGAGEIVTTGTVTRAFPVKPGETWATTVNGLPLDNLRIVFA